MKIKFLIKELSTIEPYKKSLYSIYEDWSCILCGNDDETFNHVWTFV